MDFDDFKDIIKGLMPDKKQSYVYIYCNRLGLVTSASQNLKNLNEAHKNQIKTFLEGINKDFEASIKGISDKFYLYIKEGKLGLESTVSKDFTKPKEKYIMSSTHKKQIISFIEGTLKIIN